jgi:hypothetical protein
MESDGDELVVALVVFPVVVQGKSESLSEKRGNWSSCFVLDVDDDDMDEEEEDGGGDGGCEDDRAGGDDDDDVDRLLFPILWSWSVRVPILIYCPIFEDGTPLSNM